MSFNLCVDSLCRAAGQTVPEEPVVWTLPAEILRQLRADPRGASLPGSLGIAFDELLEARAAMSRISWEGVPTDKEIVDAFVSARGPAYLPIKHAQVDAIQAVYRSKAAHLIEAHAKLAALEEPIQAVCEAYSRECAAATHGDADDVRAATSKVIDAARDLYHAVQRISENRGTP